eukprot:m.1635374 g.1635374  ORF g.1635374 m.1635374 type:complete len:138 (-) comp25421_c1_seq8:4594-5007(-)
MMTSSRALPTAHMLRHSPSSARRQKPAPPSSPLVATQRDTTSLQLVDVPPATTAVHHRWVACTTLHRHRHPEALGSTLPAGTKSKTNTGQSTAARPATKQPCPGKRRFRNKRGKWRILFHGNIEAASQCIERLYSLV